jgi:hypothetical protein
MFASFFSKTGLALFARGWDGRTTAFVVAIGAVALALLHRYFGFAEPYQMWLRLDEVALLGTWAPSSIEHLLAAFGLCSIFTLIWNFYVYPATRNRASLGILFAVLYVALSTSHDGRQFLATRDTDQLMQMLADVIGLFASIIWLAWPEPAGEAQFV